MSLSFKDAAAQVLAAAGAPLHYKAITDAALAKGLVATAGKTPWETLNAQLSVDIQELGGESRFYRHAPGTFGLRSWGLAPAVAPDLRARSVYLPTWEALRALIRGLDGLPCDGVAALQAAIKGLTGTKGEAVDWSDPDAWISQRLPPDVAKVGLAVWSRTHHHVNPRYLADYLAVPRRYGLLEEAGGVWRRTERGQRFVDEVGDDVERELDDREGVAAVLLIVAQRGPAPTAELGEPWLDWCQRYSGIQSPSTAQMALLARLANLRARAFVLREANAWRVTPAGLARLDVAMAEARTKEPGAIQPAAVEPVSLDLERLAQQESQRVRERMRELLHAMEPYALEHLVKRLLDALGYVDVEVTKPSNDKGVDVVGRIEVGITSVTEVVQVKRLQGNVQRPVVDGLRGSLHRWKAQRGTIITTGGFSKGTQEAAFEFGAAPITLIDGDKLVELLIQNDIGSRTDTVKVLRLDADAFAPRKGPEEDAQDDSGEDET